MSDLVKRLRANPRVNIFELCEEAADYIEALEAAGAGQWEASIFDPETGKKYGGVRYTCGLYDTEDQARAAVQGYIDKGWFQNHMLGKDAKPSVLYSMTTAQQQALAKAIRLSDEAADLLKALEAKKQAMQFAASATRLPPKKEQRCPECRTLIAIWHPEYTSALEAVAEVLQEWSDDNDCGCDTASCQHTCLAFRTREALYKLAALEGRPR